MKPLLVKIDFSKKQLLQGDRKREREKKKKCRYCQDEMMRRQSGEK